MRSKQLLTALVIGARSSTTLASLAYGFQEAPMLA